MRYLTWTLGIYTAIMVAGLFFKWILALWPFLFLLAVQDVVGPPGQFHIDAAMILGIIPVFLVSWLRRNRYTGLDLEPFDYGWQAFWTVILTLAGLTILALGIGKALGLTVGV